jgi:nucleoid DNA-binding protein
MANRAHKKVIDLPEEVRTEISRGLLAHGRIKVIGLGSFEVKAVGKRMGHNLATGQTEIIPGYRRIRFVPTHSIKEIL